MVSNERTPRGTSIAEQYGRPVTASDIEDLLHREQVPPGKAAKIMTAVRAALSWNRATAVRPWAGELEDGLTRQEQQRADERRARLREALLEEAARRAEVAEGVSARAAAARGEGQTVNTTPGPEAEETLAEVIEFPVAEPEPEEPAAREADPVALDAPFPGLEGGQEAVLEPPKVITPEEVPDAPEAVSEAVEEEEPEVAGEAAAVAPVGAAADAPGEPAAVPCAVAEAPPGAAVPPALPDAPAALCEPPASKRCTQCRQEKPLEFFQRDKRATDGKRPSCKSCSARYDAMRRTLKKSLRRAADTAAEEAVRAAEEADALEAPVMPPERLQEAPEAPRKVITQEAVPEAPEAPSSPAQEEEPEARRECKRCDTLKPESAFYKRRDGRARYVCTECEKRESNERRQARKRRL